MGRCRGQGFLCKVVDYFVCAFITQWPDEVHDMADERVLKDFTLKRLQAGHWVRIDLYVLNGARNLDHALGPNVTNTWMGQLLSGVSWFIRAVICALLQGNTRSTYLHWFNWCENGKIKRVPNNYWMSLWHDLITVESTIYWISRLQMLTLSGENG